MCAKIAHGFSKKTSTVSSVCSLLCEKPKTSHCSVVMLVQRYNWTILLRKWVSIDRYSQWRPLSGHVEGIFVHKNWRWEYWQHLVSTGRHFVPYSRSYIRCFSPCFWRPQISRRADVIWPAWSCDLLPCDYYLGIPSIFVKPLVKYCCTQSIMCLKIGAIV